MADIILAEHRGRTWLVSGERYIDDLLANTLPPDISIEIVPCESESDVTLMWVQNCGPRNDASSPWIIHPNIARRIRRSLDGHVVYFGQWSALIDDEAQAVIRSAALWAQDFADADIALISYVAPGDAQAIAELARLRSSLVADALRGHGVAAERIHNETRDPASVPSIGPETQRIDIVIKSEK